MELHAYTKSLNDLLSVKKTYVVPRFQREYSWTKEQVAELWEDMLACLERSKSGDFAHEEYFIGALVLVGTDKSPDYQIVDGQQRLTTITIMLSALCERFVQLGKQKIADSIYQNFIAGTDDEGKSYFKLQNESPRPFFQKRIQHISKSNDTPQTNEERTLLAAYSDSLDFTDRTKLAKRVGVATLSDDQYEAYLKAIREQVVSHLKVIFITVADEEEAYTIFETLNARGMNLSFVDLIKNKLFKELPSTHPDDDARSTWRKMRAVVGSRENVGGVEVFVRHWWISMYSYVSAENVYKSFKRLWQDGKIDPKNFLTQLHEDARLYVKIASPTAEEFKSSEEREILSSLGALRTFNVTQPRPFLLRLFKANASRLVSQAQVSETLLVLEKFHFLFNAVCSQRPSGIEASYSRAARGLRESTTKAQATAALRTLRDSLRKRVPEKNIFLEKFSKIHYSKEQPKDKRLVQYILSKMVRHTLKTPELAPHDLTIEHILPQSTGSADTVGQLGNLLPLGKALNGDAGNKSVQAKLAEYRKSDFPITAEFGNQFSGEWRKPEIQERTRRLGELAYDTIWKIA